ncbi:MAG: hypothetical protein ACLFVJ_01700 [Persicimonas sp.]
MDIEDYKERSPQVITVKNGWIRAFVGDDIPQIADALGLRSEDGEVAYAAVRRHTGARTVDAMLLDIPEWLGEGTEVFTTGQEAHIPAPSPGTTDIEELRFSAGPSGDAIPFRLRKPSFSAVLGELPALETGFSALDRLAPFCKGGLNLVLDALDGPAAFDRLCARVGEAIGEGTRTSLWLAGDGRSAEWASYNIAGGESAQRQLAALRILMSWAIWLRDAGDNVLLAAELPPLTSHGAVSEAEMAMGVSIGDVIDQLGTTLTSTEAGTITTVLRLPLYRSASGIEHIIETMDIGDLDAQVFVDDQGSFDPYRSTSNADLDAAARADQQRVLSVLSRAAAARDKSAMLGEFGIDDREKEALEQAEGLAESLI